MGSTNFLLIAWLAFYFIQVRTFPYPFLHSHQIELKRPINDFDEDERVPWDVLVLLHKSIPNSDLVLGDFACVVVRVRELYEAADQWQKDISSLTMLSLRGVKRRAPSSPEKGEGDDSEPSSSIDLDKVSKLTNDPILLKVRLRWSQMNQPNAWRFLISRRPFSARRSQCLEKRESETCLKAHKSLRSFSMNS